MSFSNKGFSLYLTLMLETVDTVIFFLFCMSHVICGILVPQPGMKLMPTTVEVRSLNHWTAREVPKLLVL